MTSYARLLVSRSYRKTPIGGIASGPSEKQFKRQTHQQARAAQRDLLKKVLVDEDVDVKMPRKSRDAENPWSGPKDGKSWFGGLKKKNPKLYDKEMRK